MFIQILVNLVDILCEEQLIRYVSLFLPLQKLCHFLVQFMRWYSQSQEIKVSLIRELPNS